MAAYCLSCIMTSEGKDLALAVWSNLGMLGCEEEELDEGRKVRVRCYFKDIRKLQIAEYEMLRYTTFSAVEIYPVPEQDYNAAWRAAMKPARLTDTFWVSPAWLPPLMNDGEQWILIEPKMSFGTGHHETTRLAAWGIERSASKLTDGKAFLDIGTGSGVLCFVAAQCGAARCIGVDVDPVCAPNLAENRRANSNAETISFVIGTPDALCATDAFGCVCMNMLYTESRPYLDRIGTLLITGGSFVWSGLLLDERNIALDLATGAGFSLTGERTENEWWCGVFTL